MTNEIENVSLFATPQFLSTAFHVFTCIEISLHSFGAYCILMHTPPAMRSVRLSLLNMHFWCGFMDFTLSCLTIPFFLLPTMSGFPLGVLRYLGIPVRYQTLLVAFSVTFMGVSIMTVFENRYLVMFAGDRWKKWRKLYFFINYLHLFILLPLSHYFIPDQKMALEQVYQMIPNLPTFIKEYPIFVFTLHPVMIAAGIWIICAIISWECVIFSVLIFCNMAKMKDGLSRHTLKLQKKFLLALLVQMVVPLGIVCTPLLFLGYMIVFDVYDQVATNLNVLAISTHGLSSTALMLYMHQPYREVCKRLFWTSKINKVIRIGHASVISTA